MENIVILYLIPSLNVENKPLKPRLTRLKNESESELPADRCHVPGGAAGGAPSAMSIGTITA